jgi:hypothetical protein
MAFTIYSDISNVVSVKTDEHGTFEVVGQGPSHARTVNMGYAEVHVAGKHNDHDIKQAHRYIGATGLKFKVEIVNDEVRLQPA